MYLLLIPTTYTSFRVAPQVQEINLSRPGTRKIYLKNESDKLKKIKIYSRRPENQKSENLYMGDWIIVYPKIVYLKPNGKKVVRMSARPPKDLTDGEYRSHLVFEELPLERYMDEKTETGKVGVSLNMIHVLVSTVYGYSGDLEYKATFDDYKVVTDKEKTYLLSKITNEGTTALDLIYKITYYNGGKQLKDEEILIGKVMRENEIKPVTELSKISSDTNRMKVEQFYRLEKDGREVREGDAEYEKFKIGEESISIERITKEEYFRKYEPQKQETTPKKEVKGVKEVESKEKDI